MTRLRKKKYASAHDDIEGRPTISDSDSVRVIDLQAARALDYLNEENLVLRKKIGGKRIRFTDKERRGLAIKAKCIDFNYNVKSDYQGFYDKPLTLIKANFDPNSEAKWRSRIGGILNYYYREAS